ncbi:TPA: transcriptional regulator [archaeon]|uniref:Transcriptional regulator n=1 Tax=Candidatus Naiadarchaeum limnaeum TaxID=2756139 RepID=A0A832UMR0_9ARCH|nr:transcriptional regulator [Candidatus Naiadarchaeales archaeon SRR2090153.bin1042]HIK00044.1 transcriptional regulator [Candidatus Naiadarchaeum limnaeum]
MAAQDKAFGFLLSVISVLIIVAWVYVMWGTEDILKTNQWLAIKIFATVLLVVIMLIVLWVGYTIATTPSIEEIEAEVRKRRKR